MTLYDFHRLVRWYRSSRAGQIPRIRRMHSRLGLRHLGNCSGCQALPIGYCANIVCAEEAFMALHNHRSSGGLTAAVAVAKPCVYRINCAPTVGQYWRASFTYFYLPLLKPDFHEVFSTAGTGCWASYAAISDACCNVRPISSSPFSKQCLTKSSI